MNWNLKEKNNFEEFLAHSKLIRKDKIKYYIYWIKKLRMKDLDFGNYLLIIRSGKGEKDRLTVLSKSLKEPLISHLKKVKELQLTSPPFLRQRIAPFV